MKNLEIKLRIHSANFFLLLPYYKEILYQTDTYYTCPDGRLKLREEKGKIPYFIFYQRPDTTLQKISNYNTYPLSADSIHSFFQVFGEVLKEELKIVKKRTLYLVTEEVAGTEITARVHVDEVEGLGNFFEVEVMMQDDIEERDADNLLRKILGMCGIEGCERVDVGYRELMMRKNVNW